MKIRPLLLLKMVTALFVVNACDNELGSNREMIGLLEAAY